MIVDVHGHWTQTPPELDAYRGRQIMQLTKTGPKGDPGISDDLLRKCLQPHLTSSTNAESTTSSSGRALG
jgi:hypothetical protein